MLYGRVEKLSTHKKVTMPRARGEPISKPREHLTDFGKLFYELCDYLDVTAAEIAQLAGLTEGLLSKNTRFTEDAQTYAPTRKTVIKIYEAFEQVASTRGLLLIPEIKQAFYNAHPAMQGTDDQAEHANRIIGQMHSMIEAAVRQTLANDQSKNK